MMTFIFIKAAGLDIESWKKQKQKNKKTKNNKQRDKTIIEKLKKKEINKINKHTHAQKKATTTAKQNTHTSIFHDTPL